MTSLTGVAASYPLDRRSTEAASAPIATLSKVAEPVTPEVVIPTPEVPTVIEPVELLDGVTEVTVLNVFVLKTVAFAAGPVNISVCALPDKSVPTTVNV